MSVDANAKMAPSARSLGPRRSKVKTGCRTCKYVCPSLSLVVEPQFGVTPLTQVASRLRKIKCDESHPVCSRCVSAGRVCQGYGVFGGGGSFYTNFYGPEHHLAAPADSSALPRPENAVSFLLASPEEKLHLEWFRRRTVTKLPGSFQSDFWTTLLIQASVSEPCILHAVLALGSFHKVVIENGVEPYATAHGAPPSKAEQLTLRHSVKAIRHLQPYFSSTDKASFRIALIACIVFASTDLMRSRFKAAQIHFQNGIRLLRGAQLISQQGDVWLILNDYHDFIDGWIVEAFARLHIQTELFMSMYRHSGNSLQMARPNQNQPVFDSFKQAWTHLDALLTQVFYLTRRARQCEAKGTSASLDPALTRSQQTVRAGLVRWLAIHKKSSRLMRCDESLPRKRATLLMLLHHRMVTIMASTCLCPSDEMAFDSHTDEFVNILTIFSEMWNLRDGLYASITFPTNTVLMSRSILDAGVLAPAYYMAIKCRVHRVRLQAIHLLQLHCHREGIWDPNISAQVCRKVMEIEERDFYNDVHNNDDFEDGSLPTAEDLLLPTVPDSYRLREVEVVFAENPFDKVSLFCRKNRDGRDCKMRIAELHLASGCWVDMEEVVDSTC